MGGSIQDGLQPVLQLVGDTSENRVAVVHLAKVSTGKGLGIVVGTQFSRLFLTLNQQYQSVVKATFLPRDAYAYSADYAVERCLSVHPSVTRRYSVKTAKHIIKVFHCRVAIPF